MSGMIELKNVTFRYPSREEMPVISLNLCFQFVVHHENHFKLSYRITCFAVSALTLLEKWQEGVRPEK